VIPFCESIEEEARSGSTNGLARFSAIRLEARVGRSSASPDTGSGERGAEICDDLRAYTNSAGRPIRRKLLRAMLCSFLRVRSERQLMERMSSLLFRWLWLVDDPSGIIPAFENRDRLLERRIAAKFLQRCWPGRR